MRYGFITLPRDIGVPLLVGVLVAGAMAVLVPKGRLEPLIGGGLLSILLMMAAAVPVYVCATASVPIAAGSMHMGASAGAALAFLIAGPATNAATFTTLWKLMGRRTALLYLGTVSLSAVICGLLIDAMFPNLSVSMPQVGTHLHEPAAAGWFTHAGAVVLLGVIGFSCRGKFLPKTRRQRKQAEQTRTSPPDDRQRLELRVRGMTCSHCAQSVQRTLAACSEVESAEVDLQGGRAVVVGRQLDHRQLLGAVAQLGYTAEIPAQQ